MSGRKTRGEIRKRSKKKKVLPFVLILCALVLGTGVYAGQMFFFDKPETKKVTKSEPKQTTESTKKEAASTKPKTEESEQAAWIESETPILFPTLMYHHIATDPTGSGNTLFVTKEEFADQMKALKEAGYYTLNTDEALRVLTENKKPAEKIVWITMDDGYANHYDTAFPILQEYGLKATINLIMDPERISQNLPEERVLEMKNAGIDFQSHTVNHLDLSSLSDEQIHEELAQSKEALDTLLNQDTKLLCYPAGRFDERVEAEAEKVGYKLAVTTNPGFSGKEDGMYSLTRVRMLPGVSGEQLLSSLGN
ncbi:MAG: polysaccharide deacetylase family protein [Lactobacillales bacterium]|jgi:peptidoglycan/xylan/chitin deacetylase (PgdA/CDA1 family)|nr:polysaccharide deacetylase family protein [Lactobacillales bacterium]